MLGDLYGNFKIFEIGVKKTYRQIRGAIWSKKLYIWYKSGIRLSYRIYR